MQDDDDLLWISGKSFVTISKYYGSFNVSCVLKLTDLIIYLFVQCVLNFIYRFPNLTNVLNTF